METQGEINLQGNSEKGVPCGGMGCVVPQNRGETASELGHQHLK